MVVLIQACYATSTSFLWSAMIGRVTTMTVISSRADSNPRFLRVRSTG